MRRSSLVAAVIVTLLVTCAIAPAADSKADDKPAASSIGEVRTQTLRGFIFFHGSTRANFQNLADKIKTMIPDLKKAVGTSHAMVEGTLIIIYHGVTENPAAEFDVEIGYAIAEKVDSVGEFKVRDVPDYHCMGLLYTGPVSSIGSAYEKLMPAVVAGGKMTGESREMYLYFEGIDSPNNVVHISAGIEGHPAK